MPSFSVVRIHIDGDFSDIPTSSEWYILPTQNVIFLLCRSDIIFAIKLGEAQYRSALAEYHCKAIQFAEGEYNWKDDCKSNRLFLGGSGWILCAPWFSDRSERLRKICVARDFTVSKCYRAFWTASTYTTFGGSHLTLSSAKQKTDLMVGFCFGGSGWIRTTEVEDNRFTVCPLWPLGNTPTYTLFSFE